MWLPNGVHITTSASNLSVSPPKELQQQLQRLQSQFDRRSRNQEMLERRLHEGTMALSRPASGSKLNIWLRTQVSNLLTGFMSPTVDRYEREKQVIASKQESLTLGYKKTVLDPLLTQVTAHQAPPRTPQVPPTPPILTVDIGKGLRLSE
jgi:hypothetical protein